MCVILIKYNVLHNEFFVYSKPNVYIGKGHVQCTSYGVQTLIAKRTMMNQ